METLDQKRRKSEEEHQRWSKEVRRGALSMLVLSLLNKKSAYGYELVKKMEEKVSFLVFEQGTIYPILRRLEKRELLSSNWSYEDKNKPKKYYSLTPEGERALDMMVRTWSKLTDEIGEIIEEADTHE